MAEEKRQRHLRFRSYKYALLSLMLVFVLLVTTGCAALLIGDNRKAYDLMVKTSEYFKYPSSVQIASGEIFGDGMYCVIRGKIAMATIDQAHTTFQVPVIRLMTMIADAILTS